MAEAGGRAQSIGNDSCESLAGDGINGSETPPALGDVVQSSGAQFGALLVVGAAIFWGWPSEDVGHALPLEDAVPEFPRLEVEGVPPLTEAEARQFLDRVQRRAERAARQETATRPAGVGGAPAAQRMRPGTLFDPEARRFVEVEPEKKAALQNVIMVDADREASKASTTQVFAAAVFYEPGGFIAVPWAMHRRSEASGSTLTGSRVVARLEYGLSSTGPDLAVARIVQAVLVDGQPVFPKGGLLRGHCRWDADRAYIEFTRVRLKGRTLRIHGVAVQNGRLGIATKRRGPTVSERVARGAGRGALDAAGDIASTLLSTTVGGRLLDGAIRGARSEVDDELMPNGRRTSYIPAGTRFQVLILEMEEPEPGHRERLVAQEEEWRR